MQNNLCRAIVGITLAVASGGASAVVWFEIARSEKFIAYADPASIRKEGETVKMWNMFDYQSAQAGPSGKQFLSVKRQFEYDCSKGRARMLAISSHAEKEAKGEVVAGNSLNLDWSPVKAGSVDASLLKYACTK